MRSTEKKAVFFDIDGTLWDRYNVIPESTIEGIRALRAAGNYAFICTGRTRSFVQHPKLHAVGFDGVLAGCGTHIEYQGELLYYHKIDRSLAIDTLHTFRKYDFFPILEGKDYIYFNEEENGFGETPYGQKLIRELGDRLRRVDAFLKEGEVSKFSCGMKDGGDPECFEKLSPHFHPLVHNPEVVEFVPNGHSKATGIQKICEYLGVDLADTYAFGDSVNDLEMLRVVGTGIAMGNGTEDAKEMADYITNDIYEDGIYNGLKHFELI